MSNKLIEVDVFGRLAAKVHSPRPENRGERSKRSPFCCARSDLAEVGRTARPYPLGSAAGGVQRVEQESGRKERAEQTATATATPKDLIGRSPAVASPDFTALRLRLSVFCAIMH